MTIDWWSEDLEEHALRREVVEAYVKVFEVKDHSAEWFEENFEEITDAYMGEWNSFEEFVQESCCDLGLTNSTGERLEPEVVNQFVSYINWEAVAIDWWAAGDFSAHETDSGTVLVFMST